MTNSTQTYWDVAGESLQTYAWNITSWGADREAPPALRGADVLIPGKIGRQWQAKVEDSRTITLGMWVQGSNEDGSMPSGGSQRAEFEHNWKNLRRLLWTPRRQQPLTKRFIPYGSSNIVAATAMGQFSAGLSPTMNGTQHAAFTCDVTLTDPYFYSPAVTLPTINPGSTNGFTYAGDGRTTRINVTLQNALASGAKLTNTSPDDSMWVQVNQAQVSGDVTTLDVANFSAVYDAASKAPYGINGLIGHGGDVNWLAFDPGDNQIKFTGSGAGSASISFQEAWL